MIVLIPNRYIIDKEIGERIDKKGEIIDELG